MDFRYQKTILINAEINEIRDTILSPRFEQEFLPEVRRIQTGNSGPIQSGENLLRWIPQDHTTIGLTRADLNVGIKSIEFQLTPSHQATAVQLTVHYSKGLEKNFVKATLAVRGLFAQKLRVLQNDFTSTSQVLAIQ